MFQLIQTAEKQELFAHGNLMCLKCSDRLPSSVIFAKKNTLKIEHNFLNVTEINLEKYKAI